MPDTLAAPSLHDIARGFARLPSARRQAFLDALRGRGIAFSRLPVLQRDDPTAPALASPAQQRLWAAHRLAPDSAAYHMPGLFRLRGPLDAGALEEALGVVADRHAILRTVYREETDGTLWAIPLPHHPITLTHHDLSGLDRAAIEADAVTLAERRAAAPFDLERAPPWRAALLRLGAEEQCLLVTLHHIAADGVSVGLLMAELSAAYSALRRGEEPDRNPPPVQHADVAAWTAAWLEAGEGDRQLDHWRTSLRGVPERLTLPDRPTTGSLASDDAGAEQTDRLPPDLTRALRALAMEQGCTLFTLLLAAYALLLGRMSGQADLIVGVPFAGRRPPEAERLIGCFVNTLPLRLMLAPAQPFRHWLDAVARVVTDAQDHADTPFDRIVAALKPERGNSPLLSVMFDHRPTPPTLTNLDGVAVEPVELPVRTAKFDLALAGTEQPDGSVLVRLAHRGDAAPAQRLLWRWRALLDRIAADPDQPLRALDPRSAGERAAIAQWSHDPAWRGGDGPGGEPPPVPLRLAALATERPDAPAVLFGDAVVSRGTLDRQSNRLAHRLIARGTGPERRIGVCLPRTPDLIVALLAVLKSGAAFVPLDPADPAERRRAIAARAGVTLLLSDQPLDGLDTLSPTIADDENDLALDRPPAVTPHPRSLAYVIHTSGSTGAPKGVAVEHGALAMHCAATAALYDMGPDSRELHFLSFTFDGAHERWMTALTAGGAILLRDDSLWTVEQTYDALRRHRLTHAGFPPKYLQQLSAWAEEQAARNPDGERPALTICSFGGEAMPRAGLERLFRSLRPRHAINGYGPTETVVTPLVWKGDGSTLPDCPYVPIGRPVGDRSAHILDADLAPQPIGVTGELWIGGGGLARGYLDRPAATADRFIPDPFGPPGGRLYRTGDLARWRDDGTVEYLGRRDHQVKLRGFRIELGEIEAQLTALPGVREAVVIAHSGEDDENSGGGVTRLISYVVPEAGRALDAAALTAGLAATLPAHMLPARLLLLDRLPVTPTGKLDRAALPLPRWEAAAQVAPATPTEDTLAHLWAEALALERVGTTDNFFDIGGDSIIALQIVARARAAGLRITPKQLLERQTVAALALVAEPVAADDAQSMAVPDGPSPLAPIQAWFAAQPIPQPNRWNQSVLLAATQPVEADRLAAALALVAARHDALRLRFTQDADGVWTQTHADGPATLPLERVEARDDADVTRLCDALQGRLDRTHGPLMRALLIATADGGQRLFLVAHHLVVDGVSWRILLDELAAALQGSCVLDRQPAPGAPFALWARRLAEAARSPRFQAQRGFWCAALDAPPLPLTDPSRPHSRRHAVAHSLRLDRARTRALLTDAPAAHRTRIDTLLLAAVAQAVGARWGLDRLTVHVEGHGREALFPDLDIGRTIGWFTSVYPLRLDLSADPSSADWDRAIRHTKEALRAVPDGGIGFNLLRHLGTAEDRAALSGPPVGVSFNYLGQFDGTVAHGPWRVAPEDCGDGTDPDAPLGAWLAFDGQVSGGELTLHARASAALLPADALSALMDAVDGALTGIAAHCAATVPGQATPSDFPLVALTQARIDALPIPAPDIADILPPTPMQAGMLCHGRLNPTSDAYRVQVWATIDGLEVERLTAVWRTVIARHAILRAALVDGTDGEDGEPPLLVVRKHAEPPIRTLDWRDRADGESAWSALCDAEFAQRFEMSQAPLMRLTLVRIGPRTHRFLWTWHHALLDGWSMSRLLGDILRLYDGEAVPPPPVELRAHAAWIHAPERAALRAAAHAHWRDTLARLTAPTRLTAVLRRPDPSEPDGAVERTLDADDVRRLQRVAAAEKVTLNTLVQAGWLRVLGAMTGQERVAFGAVMSGRSIDLPGIDHITGLLVGALPLVHPANPEVEGESDGAWLRGLLAANIAARQHEHSPPPDRQCWTDPEGAPYDSLMIFENYPVDDALRQSERAALSFRDVGNRGRMSHPLTLVVVPRDTLTLRLEHSGARFRAADIAALADRLIVEVMRLAH
jgi:amino acid adenylation domain-containing protein/non-ribosomal peptide synthase protein (TIGR01720 family)